MVSSNYATLKSSLVVCNSSQKCLFARLSGNPAIREAAQAPAPASSYPQGYPQVINRLRTGAYPQVAHSVPQWNHVVRAIVEPCGPNGGEAAPKGCRRKGRVATAQPPVCLPVCLPSATCMPACMPAISHLYACHQPPVCLPVCTPISTPMCVATVWPAVRDNRTPDALPTPTEYCSTTNRWRYY